MKTKIHIIILSLLFIALSCDKENSKPDNLEIRKITFTDCINDIDGESCLLLQAIDDNFLKIKHYNAEFCCGTEKLDIHFELQSDTIVINEIDLGPFTYCYCKHDVEFEIGPLNFEPYKLQLIESEHSYGRDTFLIEFSFIDTLNILTCN